MTGRKTGGETGWEWSDGADWRGANCRDGRGALVELFFSDEPGLIDRAKAICLGCPVAEPCLQMALERQEPWGVWGGHLFVAGRAVAVKRGRGRPRKEPALAAG